MIDSENAVVTQDGVEIEINTSLLEGPKVGDFVIVHAGFGIEILDDDEGEARLAMFREYGVG